MQSRLATRITLTIAGVVTFALCSSVVALIATWRIGALMRDTVRDNLSSLDAAADLEDSLREKRNLLLLYILDAGRAPPRDVLDSKNQDVYAALDVARHTAHTEAERGILNALRELFASYVERHEAVIALCDAGARPEAQAVFLNELMALANWMDALADEFAVRNRHSMDQANDRVQQRISRITWWVTAGSSMTIGMGTLLAWLFFQNVLFPLRRIVADARDFAGRRALAPAPLPTEELAALGTYLRWLMSDVVDTQSALDERQRQLLTAQQLASIGRLAASVAHEIRNPLTAVKMWMFAIRKQLTDDPAMDRRCAIVCEEISRLDRIVGNFLEFSRPRKVELRLVDLEPLVNKSLELFTPRFAAKGLRLTRSGPDCLPPVRADADQFTQVLINLLDNAAAATPTGGVIEIAVETICSATGPTHVVVRLRDSGPGMPTDVRTHIFEPFYTTKEDGTGLGLCIAAQIMAAHDGRIVLEKTSDEGTTFGVWLPVAQKESHEPNSGGG